MPNLSGLKSVIKPDGGLLKDTVDRIAVEPESGFSGKRTSDSNHRLFRFAAWLR